MLIIVLIAFILAFRNRSTFHNLDGVNENQMSYFNSTFEFNIFQLTAFSLGGLSTENMGIEYISGYTLVNYLIYGLFIFTMPIMFINIFQSISIGEIKNLYEDSEASEVRTKIEYVFFLEEIRQLNYFPCLKTFSYKLDRFKDFSNNIFIVLIIFF